MSPHEPAPPERWPRGLVVVLGAALLLWVLACWPLLTGSRTLFFRDLFGLFAPLKAFGAAQLREGGIPALNPTWALGQPSRGNPNAIAFYPTNVFYLVLPFWTAFNLHLCLHWLLGGVSMFLLARGCGRSRQAAAIAAFAYGGGGWVLSALSNFAVTAVAAWWPLVLLGAQRGGRRGVALGGVACGLALLAGEPITATLGLVPLAAMTVGRWGWRRGLTIVTAIGAAGLLVALPQLVASVRALGFSFRTTHGVLASQASSYRLQLPLLLELVAPLPFGDPLRAFSVVPYYYSLYPGAVASLLAVTTLRRRRGLAGLALAAVVVAWAPALPGRFVAKLLGGLVRFPEKALFWLALVWPLLAAAGLDRWREEADAAERRESDLGTGKQAPSVGGRRADWTGIVLTGMLLAGALCSAVLPRSGGIGVPSPLPSSLLLAALLVGLASWALWRGLTLVVVALQLVSLLPLQALLFAEPQAPYARASPWQTKLAERRSVLPLDYTYPPWADEASSPARRATPNERVRRLAFELGPVPGLLTGLTYPLAPDIDGLHHRFYDYVLYRLSQDTWEHRLPWLRTLGVEAISSRQPLPPSPTGPRLLAAQPFDGGTSLLYSLDAPAAPVWWPDRLTVAPNPAAAYDLVATREQPTTESVVPFAIPHRAGARVRLRRASADRIDLDVAGGGGVVVVRRAFQPLWQAHAGAQQLQVVPADVVLTGIVVPPGEHHVELFVSSRPEWTAATVAGLALAALLAAAIVPARRAEPRPPAAPGPPAAPTPLTA